MIPLTILDFANKYYNYALQKSTLINESFDKENSKDAVNDKNVNEITNIKNIQYSSGLLIFFIILGLILFGLFVWVFIVIPWQMNNSCNNKSSLFNLLIIMGLFIPGLSIIVLGILSQSALKKCISAGSNNRFSK